MSYIKIENINSDFYRDAIIKQGKSALLCFGSDWSQPCRDMQPVLEQVADEYYGTIIVAAVDPDDEPLVAAECDIVSIPTLVFFKGSEAVDKMVGIRSFEDVQKMIIKGMGE